MKSAAAITVIFAAFASAGAAQPLKGPLAGLSFMVGDRSAGRDVVTDTGGTSTGHSLIEPAADGAVLLVRSHTELYDRGGKPAGGFGQILMIYPEGDTLHADYSDGPHVIHYSSASVDPGRSVTFQSATPAAGVPQFKLSYELAGPDILGVSFMMAPPGGGDFRPVATGELRRPE